MACYFICLSINIQHSTFPAHVLKVHCFCNDPLHCCWGWWILFFFINPMYWYNVILFPLTCYTSTASLLGKETPFHYPPNILVIWWKLCATYILSDGIYRSRLTHITTSSDASQDSKYWRRLINFEVVPWEVMG